VTRVWPEPVERVAAYVRHAGAEARIEEFPAGTPTARAAAEAVGCALRQIVKSLVFECDRRPVLAMVPGDRRADAGKVATATGAEVGGTPLASVVWLANKLAEWGGGLHAGDIVSAGSVSKILRPGAGESVRASFTRLGSIAARFV